MSEEMVVLCVSVLVLGATIMGWIGETRQDKRWDDLLNVLERMGRSLPSVPRPPGAHIRKERKR